MCHDGWDQVEIASVARGCTFCRLGCSSRRRGPLVAHIEVVQLYVLRSGVQSNDGCAAWKCKHSRVVDVSCVVQEMSFVCVDGS